MDHGTSLRRTGRIERTISIIFCFFLLPACSASRRPIEQTTRIGIEASAHGLAAVDTAVSKAIQRDALAPHEPGAVGAKWRGTVEALEHTHAALILAERAVDTYTATRGSACPAYVAVLAVKDSTSELTTALRAVGVAIPDAFVSTLPTILTAAQQLAPQCPDGGTP